MMEWIPVILVTFKVVVLAIGMFYAIKWHYDQGKKGKQLEKEVRTVLRASGVVVVVFTLSFAGLGFATFALARMLGMDMNLP